MSPLWQTIDWETVGINSMQIWSRLLAFSSDSFAAALLTHGSACLGSLIYMVLHTSLTYSLTYQRHCPMIPNKKRGIKILDRYISDYRLSKRGCKHKKLTDISKWMPRVLKCLHVLRHFKTVHAEHCLSELISCVIRIAHTTPGPDPRIWMLTYTCVSSINDHMFSN